MLRALVWGLQLYYNGHKHTMFRTCPVRNGTCATERNPDGSIKGTIYFTGGNAGESCAWLLTGSNSSIRCTRQLCL